MKKQIKLSPPQKKYVLEKYEVYLTQERIDGLEKEAILTLKEIKTADDLAKYKANGLLRKQLVLPELEKVFMETLKKVMPRNKMRRYFWTDVMETLHKSKFYKKWYPEMETWHPWHPEPRKELYKKILAEFEKIGASLLKQYKREDFFEVAKSWRTHSDLLPFKESDFLTEVRKKINGFFESDLKEKLKTYDDIPYFKACCDGIYSFFVAGEMLNEKNKEIQKKLSEKYQEHLSKKIDFEIEKK